MSMLRVYILIRRGEAWLRKLGLKGYEFVMGEVYPTPLSLFMLLILIAYIALLYTCWALWLILLFCIIPGNGKDRAEDESSQGLPYVYRCVQSSPEDRPWGVLWCIIVKECIFCQDKYVCLMVSLWCFIYYLCGMLWWCDLGYFYIILLMSLSLILYANGG